MAILQGVNLDQIARPERRRDVQPDYYRLQYHSSEDKVTAKGNRFLSVRFTVLEGKQTGETHKGRAIFSSYFWTSDKNFAKEMFKNFVLACGIAEEYHGADFDTEWLDERTLIAKAIKNDGGFINLAPVSEMEDTPENWASIDAKEESDGGNGVHSIPDAVAPPVPTGGTLIAPPLPTKAVAAPAPAPAAPRPMVPPAPRIPAPAPPPRAPR